MRDKANETFAFLVLAYNHEKYIIEHLESIKYLVLSHGEGWDIDLIISDDCSRDQTRQIIDKWLAANSIIFRYVKTIYNIKNLGTCASVENILANLVAEHCKLTAGDDVYSFENIFTLTREQSKYSIISGRPLHLVDNKLKYDIFTNIMMSITQVIYRNTKVLHALKHFSYINTPNVIYARQCLMHESVRQYLQHYDVVEDWPIQISIARQFPERGYSLIDKVFVYYRRTLGSAYIVANQRFLADKIAIYNDLIKLEDSWLERIRLRSRKICVGDKYRFFKKFLNMDLYAFILASIFNIFKIIERHKLVKSDVAEHVIHYEFIKKSSLEFSNKSELGKLLG